VADIFPSAILNPSMNEKDPIRVGFLGFEGLMALDLVGPIDAFTSAFVEGRNGEVSNCYEVVIIGLSGQPFTSESGVVFKPHKTIKNAPSLDTLIIPGGKGLRVSETQKKAAGWISSRAATTRRIATVCTGTFGLAATGLLNGRCVTTHWRQAQELAQRFPELKVDPNALYLKDGKFYTCAGITAGIDLSLALIEEDFGPRVALSVARELVVYLKRRVDRSSSLKRYSFKPAPAIGSRTWQPGFRDICDKTCRQRHWLSVLV